MKIEQMKNPTVTVDSPHMSTSMCFYANTKVPVRVLL